MLMPDPKKPSVILLLVMLTACNSIFDGTSDSTVAEKEEIGGISRICVEIHDRMFEFILKLLPLPDLTKSVFC